MTSKKKVSILTIFCRSLMWFLLHGHDTIVRKMRPTLIALLNSVLVVGGTFVFVFKAVEYSMTTPDVTVQVMASLIAALIVALAEVYFIAKIIWDLDGFLSSTAYSLRKASNTLPWLEFKLGPSGMGLLTPEEKERVLSIIAPRNNVPSTAMRLK